MKNNKYKYSIKIRDVAAILKIASQKKVVKINLS